MRLASSSHVATGWPIPEQISHLPTVDALIIAPCACNHRAFKPAKPPYRSAQRLVKSFLQHLASTLNNSTDNELVN